MAEIEIIRHPQIDGLSVFFNTVDYRTPHLHTELELLLVMDQSLMVTCEQKQILATPGTLLLFNPRQLHEFYKQEKSCTFLCVQISPKCFAVPFPALEQIFFDELLPERAMDPENKSLLFHELFDLAFAYFNRQPGYELFCVGKTALLLHRLLSHLPTHRITKEEETEQFRRNARLQRLLDFVDENYMHKIRLSDFAAMENRSMSYLSHFVKDTINQSFQEYVNAVRFNAACKLMQESNMRLLDICVETGFSDYRYFSEAFRRRTGLTPEEYRRQLTAKPAEIKVHHSIHSLERFYTREKNIQLLELYRKNFQ